MRAPSLILALCPVDAAAGFLRLAGPVYRRRAAGRIVGHVMAARLFHLTAGRGCRGSAGGAIRVTPPDLGPWQE